MVSPPIALEPVTGVEMLLHFKKLPETGMSLLDLVAGGPAVVGQVVGTAERQRELDEGAESFGCAGDTFFTVLGVEIEDDAGVVFTRPGEEAFLIALDQANGAVNNWDATVTKSLCRRFHEGAEMLARDIKLADHLTRWSGRAALAVEFAVVIVQVDAELMGVRPVEGLMGAQVEIRINTKNLRPVMVGEVDQFLPICRVELLAGIWHWGGGIDRAVAGEDAALKEARRSLIDRKLEVTIETAGCDAFFECRDQLVDVGDFDKALELLTGSESEKHGGDHAEAAVATDGETEELIVITTAATVPNPVAVDQGEGFDVVDERSHFESAAVDVGGE